MRKETGIEAEASEGHVAGKALGAGASGSFRGWVALPGVGVVRRPHQSLRPAQLYTQRTEAQEKGDVGSTWSLLLLLQDPCRYQLFLMLADPTSGLGWAPAKELA